MARRPAPPGVDRRQQILEAALDVFAEQGFDGATNKDIAARADVTPGLIYFYFPGKEELFFAAFAHQAQHVMDQLRLPSGDESDPRPPEQVIRAAVGSLVEALDDPRSLSVYRMMMRAVVHNEGREGSGRTVEDARCYMRDQWQGIGAHFRDYLDAEIARGRLRPVNTALATQVIIHSVIFAVMRRAAGDPKLAAFTRDDLVDSLVDICLHGMLPDDAATSPATARHGAGPFTSLDPPAAMPATPGDAATH